ncbi:MAG: hypothetical protein SFU27_11510 [Thermonemataceae bacterium]|nr:hypothetical protein [Thermonemataceae bacterium]
MRIYISKNIIDDEKKHLSLTAMVMNTNRKGKRVCNSQKAKLTKRATYKK